MVRRTRRRVGLLADGRLDPVGGRRADVLAAKRVRGRSAGSHGHDREERHPIAAAVDPPAGPLGEAASQSAVGAKACRRTVRPRRRRRGRRMCMRVSSWLPIGECRRAKCDGSSRRRLSLLSNKPRSNRPPSNRMQHCGKNCLRSWQKTTCNRCGHSWSGCKTSVRRPTPSIVWHPRQNPPVELLFRCLRGPTVGQRTAAALALGRLNQPAVSRQLIAMIERGTYRQEAMIALLSSSEPIARQFLADAERNQMLAATLWNAKRQLQNPFTWRS